MPWPCLPPTLSQHSPSGGEGSISFHVLPPLGPFFTPCFRRICRPHPLACFHTELGKCEDKASIRQGSNVGGGVRRLQACPNPRMPEKAPRAPAAWRLEASHSLLVDSTDQAWPGAGSTLCSHMHSSRQPSLLWKTWLPALPHVQTGWASCCHPLCSLPRGRWDP